MTIVLDNQVAALLQDEQAVKILATGDKLGKPHIVVDPTIHLDADGNIVYLEFIETSRTNSNLINALWFKRQVALFATSVGLSYEISGTPIRSIISGPVFEQYYRAAQKRNADADLSTVWIITPEQVSNESYDYLRQKEQEEHPLVGHLDRLAK